MMLTANFKADISGKDMRRLAKAVPVSIRNSVNKTGAVERRKIADRIGRITGEDRLKLLRTRVYHFPAKLGNLESSIVVLGPRYDLDDEQDGPPRKRTRGAYEMPVSAIRGTLPEPSLEEYVDGIMEEFEMVMQGHFFRYLLSISGLVD